MKQGVSALRKVNGNIIVQVSVVNVSARRITRETCKRKMVYMFHVSAEFLLAEICKKVSIKFPLNGYNGKVLTNFWFG